MQRNNVRIARAAPSPSSGVFRCHQNLTCHRTPMDTQLTRVSPTAAKDSSNSQRLPLSNQLLSLRRSQFQQLRLSRRSASYLKKSS